MGTIRTINIALEMFGAILSFFILIGMVFGKLRNERKKRLFLAVLICNTLLLLVNACAWCLEGQSDVIGRFAQRITLFLAFFLVYILLPLFTEYVVEHISYRIKMSRLPANIMWGVSLASIILLIIAQFNDMYYWISLDGVCHWGKEWYWMSGACGVSCVLVNGYLLLRVRKALCRREAIVLTACLFFPFLAMLIETIANGLAVLYLAFSISCLWLYMEIQVEQSEDLRKKELELERSSMNLMLSQIQPHFLYNSLTTIRYLCNTDPGQAGEAVSEFAGFLRANMDSLSCQEPITFDRELNHVKNYLALERRRFGDRLKVVYEIGVWEFRLPPLTLQPIVENAVRHGIMRKVNGGTVLIRTEESSRSWRVVVQDDGPGFRADSVPGEGRVHLGLENVQKRLAQMCGGELEIGDAPEGGTAITITVPKQGK